MALTRRCSRTACGRAATTTLTYVYSDMTAVVGPLATYAEPHAYDLCEVHSQRLSAPRGWEVMRLAVDDRSGPSSDDLLALADAVREAAAPRPVAGRVAGDVPGQAVGDETLPPPTGRSGVRRGHLQSVRPE